MTNILPFTDAEADFEQQFAAFMKDFWEVYPKSHKDKKQACIVKLKTIVTTGLQTKTLDKDSGGYVDIFLKAEMQEIIDGLLKYQKHCWATDTPQQYIKNPLTWINQGGWES